MAAVILPSVTSCLGDDKDDSNNTYRPLTQTEKDQIMFNIAGDYTAKAYFINTEQKDDSLNIHYTITAQDSALVINDFDMKMLEQYSKVVSERFSNIVAQAGKTELRLVLHPYYNNNFTIGLYSFTLTNDHPTTLTFNDGEKDHVIAITMAESLDYYSYPYTNRYYSVAEYYNKKMQLNVIIKSLTVDGDKFDVNALIGVYAEYL